MLSVGGSGRSRAKSPGGGRERDRSRSNVRDERDRKYSSSSRKKTNDDDSPPRRRRSQYDDSDSDPEKYRVRKPEAQAILRAPSDSDSDRRPKKSSIKKDSKNSTPRSSNNNFGVVPMPAPVVPGGYSNGQSRHMSFTAHDPRYAAPVNQYAVPGPDGYAHHRSASNVGQGPQYAAFSDFKYAQVTPRVNYKTDDTKPTNGHHPAGPKYIDVRPDQFESHPRDKYDRKHDVDESTRRVSRLSMSGVAPAGLGASLAVAGHAISHGGGKPPASPLLEAYKGTYQSVSPMPGALVLANHKDDSDLSDFELGSASSSSSSEAEEEEVVEESDSGISDHDPNADIKRKIWRLEKEKRDVARAKERDAKKAQKAAEKQAKKASRHEYERRRPAHMQQHDHMETRAPDGQLVLMGPPHSSRDSVMSLGRKRVSFYDAEPDAKDIAAALKGTSRAPNVKPLIKILPHLTIDDLDALKAEYKKYAKIDGAGINLSKHIKVRVPGYLGKAAYATSLGQYESEGYWANCFYQAGASRRELLIESLMGRTNQQIREIKNFFKDKKYDDDLERCLKTELKADKFRNAILLALQEQRMPESSSIDPRLVTQDARDLFEALNSSGGESAMIQIIVLRSDAHLREVLQYYERKFGRNFARDMIGKSRNLVGETLAHILNGALNRPMRDAILLHQAIAETEPGKERAELLISRLVRLHWEPRHLEKVKIQYASRYGVRLDDAIRHDIQAKMKTEEGHNWTNFCIQLIRSSEP